MTRRLSLLLLLAAAFFSAAAQLNTDRTLQVGRNALYFSDYTLAIRYFNQVIDAKPYLAEPYYLRAIAKYNLDDFAGAQTDAARAVELNPFLPEAWEVSGVTNQFLRRFPQAIADYDRALELLPANRNLLFNKALAQEEASMLSAADSTYSELLGFYPRYADGYVGRAQLSLRRGDSIAARADLDRAIEFNANSVGALTLRAALNADSDPEAALADMEQAVRLRPDRPYLRVNRAVARYKAGKLNDALADLDYVLELEPMNAAALTNRALLRMELKDNDRALADLNLLLKLNPADMRALYNRALVLAEKGDFDAALADADAVVDAHPSLFASYALRAQVLNDAGRRSEAEADFRRANRIAHSAVTEGPAADIETAELDDSEATRNRFAALRTITDEETDETTRNFNARGMKSRSADRNSRPDLLPIYQLSYYTADEGASDVYDREIQALNAARVLPFILFLTNNLPALSRDADTARHFESISRLTALIDAGNARPIDRFARAMDYMTVRAYSEALSDFDAVISSTPDFAPAYLMRAAARYRLRESQQGRVIVADNDALLSAEATLVLDRIMSDLDRALELNPGMAVAHYNRGVFLMRLGADVDAHAAFTRAIEINPDLGPAYYNRGYIEFSRGNADAARADLSRAGQLGVHAAYSLLRALER